MRVGDRDSPARRRLYTACQTPGRGTMDSVLSTELLARLRAFIRRRVGSDADADDLLQDVLARLVERRNEISGGSIPAWLFTVARRAIVDRYRARGGAAGVREADAAMADEGHGPTRELAACLEPMLMLLDDDDRALLRRVDMDGESQAEIARRLGVSVSTVKSRTQRARSRLRTALTDCCAVRTHSSGKPYDYELRKGKTCPGCGDGCG